MATARRRQYLIVPKVQTALLARVAWYWLYCLLAVTLMVIGWEAYRGPARPSAELLRTVMENYLPALVCSLIMLPIVMIDMTRMSNRFAGPIFRLKRELERLNAGGPVVPVRFRDNDFHRDLADEVNRLLENRVAKNSAEFRAALEAPQPTGTEESEEWSDEELFHLLRD